MECHSINPFQSSSHAADLRLYFFLSIWPLAIMTEMTFSLSKASSSLPTDNITDLPTQAMGFKVVYPLALVGLP